MPKSTIYMQGGHKELPTVYWTCRAPLVAGLLRFVKLVKLLSGYRVSHEEDESRTKIWQDKVIEMKLTSKKSFFKEAMLIR